MIDTKDKAYSFVRNEELDIKRFLLDFSYYATTYEKNKVIECKELINFKISALNRKLSLQTRHSIKTIIEDEILFLKKLKMLVLKVQDFLFLSSKRFRKRDEFFILISKFLHYYKNKTRYFNEIIQRGF